MCNYLSHIVRPQSLRHHQLNGIANLLGGIEHMVVIEMRIARGRLVIGMTKQPPDHRQGFLVHRGMAEYLTDMLAG